MRTVGTVSYTHLDVYKRQKWDTPQDFIQRNFITRLLQDQQATTVPEWGIPRFGREFKRRSALEFVEDSPSTSSRWQSECMFSTVNRVFCPELRLVNQ